MCDYTWFTISWAILFRNHKVDYFKFYDRKMGFQTKHYSFRSIAFYRSAVRSSQKLHDEMFQGVVGAPMRFFDTNPSGRILNR